MVWTYYVAMEQYRKLGSEKRTRIVGKFLQVSPFSVRELQTWDCSNLLRRFPPARLPSLHHCMQPHRNCPHTIVLRLNEHARRAMRNASVVQEPPIKVKGMQLMLL